MTLLVAGVGNVFQGDDAFGCEVLRRLAARALPAGVVVRDFGTAALDLRFWMEKHEAVIVVDVVARGRPPGTLVVLDPEGAARVPGDAAPHGLTATDVVAWAVARRARGETPRHLRLVGCEPATFGEEDGALGLSPAVEDAVPHAVDLVLEVVASLLALSATEPVADPAADVGGPACTSSG